MPKTPVPGIPMQSPQSTSRLFNAVETSHARAVAALILICLALFLPGLTALPPMDRDEPRFAQATKQMLETGDFVDIRFQTEARHKKPVGIYWLQAGAVAAGQALGVPDARHSIAVYRMPSLIGAILAVLLTYWAGLPLAGRRSAFIAAGLLAATILLGVEARLAKTDAVLTATVVACMGVLARLWMARTEDRTPAGAAWVVFWLALGIGILVKGPIGPLVVGLAALVLAVAARSGRWLAALRPAWGLLLLVVVVAPWFVAIALKTHCAFFAESVGHDMLAKVADSQESHGAPPGTYLLSLAGTFWPASPLLLLALPFAWRERRDPAVLFALAWVLPMWLVFELVPTKLPHYVLPLFPGLALLVAVAAHRGGLVAQGVVARLVTLLWPLPVAILAVAAFVLSRLLGDAVPWLGLAVIALAVLPAVFAWTSYRSALAGTASLAMIVAAVLVAAGVYGLAAPALQAIRVSGRLAQLTQTLPCGRPALVTAGFREPSLVFLTRSDLVMADGAGAARFLAGGDCRLAFVEAREGAAFDKAAAETGASSRLIGHVAGVNINGGRKLDIAVYASGTGAP
jgi:4-amino-4-deoxy-L-arabinose transferase-like glycosyltransferase